MKMQAPTGPLVSRQFNAVRRHVTSLAHSALGSLSPSGPFADLCCPQVKHGTFEADYKLSDKVLGSGMNGQVFKAVCRQSGRQVAVKTYRIKEMESDDLQKLREEIEIQAALSHPSIASIEAVYCTKTKVDLVIELLEGGDLLSRGIKHEQPASPAVVSETFVAEAMFQLLDALHHIHAKGIVHRDVKPENLVFENAEGGTLKLIDFGLTARVKAGQALTDPFGTLQYAAPEVMRKGASYDQKADMWSVGCVAYVLLTGGMSPYMCSWSDDERMEEKVVFGDVNLNLQQFTRCSQGARNFVTALLVVDPKKRLSAQQALQHPWITTRANSFVRSDTGSTFDDSHSDSVSRETSSESVPLANGSWSRTAPRCGSFTEVLLPKLASIAKGICGRRERALSLSS